MTGPHAGRLEIGLTGGVGAGKSTVAARLVEHGAVLIDADRIAREVVEPGTPGLAAVVEHFGTAVVAGDGRLDRPALAAVVFGDPEQLAALNAITHPLIQARSAQVRDSAPADAVIVWDVPLLVEGGRGEQFDAVVVVEAPRELRLARLTDRGLPADQAEARMSAQATDEQRRAVADEVIVNDGDLDRLFAQVDQVWDRLAGRGRSRPAAGIG